MRFPILKASFPCSSKTRRLPLSRWSVEPNALEEVKRHDDIDFKGFGQPNPQTREG